MFDKDLLCELKENPDAVADGLKRFATSIRVRVSGKNFKVLFSASNLFVIRNVITNEESIVFNGQDGAYEFQIEEIKSFVLDVPNVRNVQLDVKMKE